MKFIKLYNLSFLYLVLFFTSAHLSAQDSIASKPNENRFILVKMNLTSLIDYTPSFQFSYQYNVYQRLYIQHEAGYITGFISPFWDNNSNMNGFRIKNQIKYYITPASNDINNFYFAADIMYKRTAYFDEKEFGVYDMSYFQSIRFKKTKEVIGISLIVGFEPVINEKNIVLDLYTGFGFRHLTINDDIAPDLRMVGWDIFRRNEGNYNMPGLYFGFRMGYKFKSFLNSKSA